MTRFQKPGDAGVWLLLLDTLDTVPLRAKQAFQARSREAYMAIPQDLLDILVCPVCKTPVKLLADGSGLKCQSCRRIYPVRDDIPIMLSEEATVAPE